MVGEQKGIDREMQAKLHLSTDQAVCQFWWADFYFLFFFLFSLWVGSGSDGPWKKKNGNNLLEMVDCMIMKVREKGEKTS